MNRWLKNLIMAAALAGPITVVAIPVATNVDGTFTLTNNADIFNSTTVPHTTVSGALANSPNGVAYYSFTGVAGATVFFDHDGGPAGTLALLDDSVLALFRSSGELIALGDDTAAPKDPGSPESSPGSDASLNAFVGVLTLPADDIYYLGLGFFSGPAFVVDGCVFAFLQRPDGADGGVSASNCNDRSFYPNIGTPLANAYTLHISYAAPSVPEPGTLALLGLGLAGLAATRRRR